MDINGYSLARLQESRENGQEWISNHAAELAAGLASPSNLSSLPWRLFPARRFRIEGLLVNGTY